MKIILSFLILLLIMCQQALTQVISTNRNAVGLEHNLLFNAIPRYQVKVIPENFIVPAMLFDGSFMPTYSNAGVSSVGKLEITIDNLPEYHTQAGAWIGWSTRYWPASKFKIEIYNTWPGTTLGWITLADQTNFYGGDFTINVTGYQIKTIRFTFYEASGDNGRIGISEIYYLHPEATTPYQGLGLSGANLYEVNGLVGIGTKDPKAGLHVTKVNSISGNNIAAIFGDYYNHYTLFGGTTGGRIRGSNEGYLVIGGNPSGTGDNKIYMNHDVNSNISMVAGGGNVIIGKIDQTDAEKAFRLDVKGKVRADEIVVNTSGADFVFDTSYILPSLQKVEQHIKENGFLPNVPSAAQMQNEGIGISEMQTILLQKVEELTLYVIELQKQNERLQKQVNEIKK